jgi:hypothetical protein
MTTHNRKLKLLVVAAAAAFGLAAGVRAQSPNVAVPNPGAVPVQGLLGSAYAGVAGTYADLHGGPPSVARGWSLYYNQPLMDGLDLTLDYNGMRTRAFGLKATDQRVDSVLTYFFKQDWGKPLVAAGVDWDWQHSDFASSNNGLGLLVGTGVEFQVAPAFVVTPFVNFVRQTASNQNEFDSGAKATYRFSREWSVTAKAQYDAIRSNPDRMEYSLGVNYHY